MEISEFSKSISLEIVVKDINDDMPVLAQLMPWCRFGTRTPGCGNDDTGLGRNYASLGQLRLKECSVNKSLFSIASEHDYL